MDLKKHNKVLESFGKFLRGKKLGEGDCEKWPYSKQEVADSIDFAIKEIERSVGKTGLINASVKRELALIDELGETEKLKMVLGRDIERLSRNLDKAQKEINEMLWGESILIESSGIAQAHEMDGRVFEGTVSLDSRNDELALKVLAPDCYDSCSPKMIICHRIFYDGVFSIIDHRVKEYRYRGLYLERKLRP